MREPIAPKDKKAIEKRLGCTLSEFMIGVLLHIDEDYLLSELQEKCRERDVVVSGGKHKLAFRLLVKEVNL